MEKFKKLLTKKWFLITVGLVLLVLSPALLLLYLAVVLIVWLVKKYGKNSTGKEAPKLQSNLGGKSIWTTPLSRPTLWILAVAFLVLSGALIVAINPAAHLENLPATTSQPKQEEFPKFLSLICSKPENAHNAYYYFVNYYPYEKSFPLPEKLVDVDVRISTIRNDRKNWDTNFLCSPESVIDLPDYQWQILTAGSDCGVGAAIEPCDVDFVSDNDGVTGIVIAPRRRSDSYVSGTILEYFQDGALLKITGQPIE